MTESLLIAKVLLAGRRACGMYLPARSDLPCRPIA